MTAFSGKMNHGGPSQYYRGAAQEAHQVVRVERKEMKNHLHEEKMVFNSSYEFVMEAPELFPIRSEFFDADL